MFLTKLCLSLRIVLTGCALCLFLSQSPDGVTVLWANVSTYFMMSQSFVCMPCIFQCNDVTAVALLSLWLNVQSRHLVDLAVIGVQGLTDHIVPCPGQVSNKVGQAERL